MEQFLDSISRASAAGLAVSIGGRDYAYGVHRLHVETQLARDNPANVKQDFDELRLSAGVAFDGRKCLIDRGPQDRGESDSVIEPHHDIALSLCAACGEELVFSRVELGLVVARSPLTPVVHRHLAEPTLALIQHLFGALAPRDIAGDFQCPDELPRSVPDSETVNEMSRQAAILAAGNGS